MINVAKCPKCEAIIRSVSIEAVDVKQGMQSKFHGVSYSCPSCRTVLSVSIDPIAIKTDIVKELKKALAK